MLVAAVVWAAWLRLGWPEAYPFAYDEARLSALALALAREGRWPITGMVSSTGIPNFPAAVWLFALPYLFSPDPLLATRFVAFLSLGVVVGVWWLARRWWGPLPALAAAWGTAGSPYLAFYARNIWAQNWLPILAVGWAILVWKTAKRSCRGCALGVGLLTAWTPQVHYAGVVLWVPALVLAWRLPQARRLIGLGWIVGTLPAWPTLAALWSVRNRVEAALQTMGGDASLWYPWQLLTGYGWDRYLIGPRWGLGTHPLLLAAGALLLAAWLGGMGYLVREIRRRQALTPWVAVVLAWMGGSLVVWHLPVTPNRLHYYLPALPAWWLVTVGAFRWSRSARVHRVLLALAVGISLVQGMLFLRGVQVSAQVYTPGGISTPLGYLQIAARTVQDGRLVTVLVPGDDPTVDGDAAVWDVLLWETPHRLVDGRSALLWREEEGWLLLVAPWLPAWDVLQTVLPEAAATATFIPKREGEYPFVRVSVGKVLPTTTRTTMVPLANGVSLVGWQLLPSPERTRLITLWRVYEASTVRYHQFNHVYVPGQETPLWVQDGPVSSLAWQPGDWLITWADFPPDLPATAWFGVGMYTYPDLQRVPRLDAADPYAAIPLRPKRR